jgi:hypothetical protein
MSPSLWTPDWQDHWDPEVGLWCTDGPGHTVSVRGLTRLHPGREASLRLVQAALVGQLDRIEVARVLGALRQMQVTAPGKHHGCFRWYWEEPEPLDTNAAFFTIINLLALHLCFRDKLDAASQGLLAAMFADARLWFVRAVEERQVYYPNKYLGDLVCAWLLLEVTGAEDTRPPAPLPKREGGIGTGGGLAQAMLDAAAYWQENGWGWGEHMSDGYCAVCLQELSLLLLFAERLPEEVRRRYRALLADLLAIEDAFDGGIRVPAIRSYAFSRSPQHTNYRDRVRPWDPGAAEIPHAEHGPALENLFALRGWHDLVPSRAEAQRNTCFPCFGGAAAVGRQEPDIRLGSMTRYPIMPGAEHDTWGLCWQSFPVCLWRPVGDWGFLQWEVKAGDRIGAHPATGSFFTSYGNAALAPGLNPPLVGRTWAVQQGGNVAALRIMPALQAGWEYLCDRFRLIEGHAQVQEQPEQEGLRQLLLTYPERTVAVACLPLGGTPEVILRGGGESPLDWELRYAEKALEARRAVVTLWGLTLDGPIAQAPVLEPDPEAPRVPRDPEEQAWLLTWRWPGTEWRLRIDPLAEDPFRLA